MKSSVKLVRRLAVAAGLVLGAVSAVPLLASPASAATPTGGCWVWGGSGSGAYDVSSSLAPWTDPAVAPAGAADYSIALTPASPHPGDTITISMTFNKGPKNGGPPATVVGTYSFSVNSTTVTGTKNFGTVNNGAVMPGATVTAEFVAVDGANDVTFSGVQFIGTAGSSVVKIDCNGQSSGVAGGNNPRTAPLATNVTGTVTASGTPVTPSLTPSASPTTSTSATPSTSTSPTASATATTTPTATSTATAGQAAKGKTTFACTLNPLDSDFDYPVTVTVSGYRESAGDPVSLVATMTNIPGIAPLPIDADMDVTLGVSVGGTKATLKGSSHVAVGVKAPVPVPDLTGEVTSDEESMKIAVTAFTFDFPDMDIDADCSAPGGTAAIGTMKVGSEPVDTDGGGDGGGGGTTTSSGGSLPGTGGPMSLPVLGLLAGALLLIGAGVLTLLPTARPYRRQH